MDFKRLAQETIRLNMGPSKRAEFIMDMWEKYGNGLTLSDYFFNVFKAEMELLGYEVD